MKTPWAVCFNCRTLGAIGIFYPVTWNVEASNREEAIELARQKACETHEHLHLVWAEPSAPRSVS
jgi:hypothetical protein